MSLRRQNGFTLVELMVTLAVVAILAAIAFPSFQSTIRSNRLASANNEMIGLLSWPAARRSATARWRRLWQQPMDQLRWRLDKGMLAWSDADGDGASAGETVLRFVQFHPKLASPAPAGSVIAFDGRGAAGRRDQEIVLQPDAVAATHCAHADRRLRADPSTKEACQ
jgi:type IV fimbrial biogenesis protein FimT